MRLFISIFLISILASCSDVKEPTIWKGEAQIFAPDMISTFLNERDLAMSKDGKIIYFSVYLNRQNSIICTSKKVNNVWQKPHAVSFSGKYVDIEPSFHPDGRLFFVSNRPVNANEVKTDFDIWYVNPTENGWSEPVNMGMPINTKGNEFYPTFANDGTLNFTATYEEGLGGEDLWLSEYVDGKYQKPMNLGDSINTRSFEYNSLISPEGDYIIYTGHGWGPGYGSGDLYISFKNQDGTWSKAKNMGDKVNTESMEYCPAISPDGKYFFFTRNLTLKPDTSGIWTYDEIVKRLWSNQNGQGDIYFIKADFIDELRN